MTDNKDMNKLAKYWAEKQAKSEAEAFEKAMKSFKHKENKEDKILEEPHDESGLLDDYCP